ncbi:hypothetical protein CDEST_04196 [Colletotrichum destructivum]|uniref:Uncharacterized protein n=1 Tax=Colletotrichum destructivum TaxID=34406 RepID=A0AAX4I727_9PEZI|nr:hypothetical protein CDEST_04196 [Colletotrichum destructivum]
MRITFSSFSKQKREASVSSGGCYNDATFAGVTAGHAGLDIDIDVYLDCFLYAAAFLKMMVVLRIRES